MFLAAGELDIDEDQPAAVKRIRSKYGATLLTNFMEYLLGDKTLWKQAASCLMEHPQETGDNPSKKPKFGNQRKRPDEGQVLPSMIINEL